MRQKAEAKVSSEKIVQILEDDILGGTLRPGEKLDEQSLANRFSVSRTPVREAIRQLAANGLIEIRRNMGATVRQLTAGEVVDMFMVLAELEGLAARLCARRMTMAEIDEAKARNDDCLRAAETGDQVAFLEANNAFHDVLLRGTRSAYLATEAARLGRRLAAYRRVITHPRQMMSSHAEHQRIIAAISQGEEDVAQAAMRTHVDVIAGSAADIVLALEANAAPLSATR
ncbi:GntR family transcriptional regulator [Paracoccus sulfuroxidans]|uniref:GntR family transcriptional regulator n=1 Tax=Paracoccus sulfuroxidans TaxID=384678 RepID=UPI0013155993|nr:GntR family transcriptional regulator [Paracoccus sulfuroxidans]